MDIIEVPKCGFMEVQVGLRDSAMEKQVGKIKKRHGIWRRMMDSACKSGSYAVGWHHGSFLSQLEACINVHAFLGVHLEALNPQPYGRSPTYPQHRMPSLFRV